MASSSSDQNIVAFIDGKKSDQSAMRALDPKQIESVEVLKGDAARAMSAVPEATGVIVIRTKSAK